MALPSVEASPANGSPAFKIRGQLQARVPTHHSADPGSLMVRVGFDDRAELLAAAPDVHHRSLPQLDSRTGWPKDIFLLCPGRGLAIGSGLWETVSMAIAKIKAGQIVVSDGLVGVYRVVAVSPDGKMADVEKFDVSKQKSLGDPVRSVALDKLTAYKEDASQAAARIVREATTED